MKNRIVNISAAIIAAVCVICISVTATVMARPLYYHDIEALQIPETSGYSKDICKENYDTLIDYNLLGGEAELEFPFFSMSEQGKIHFEEVKDIFITMQILSIAGVLLLLCFALCFRKKAIGREYTRWMRLTGAVLAAIAIIVGLAMAIDWQWSFELMHRIFFDNDYWLFDPATDPVITILPDEFFLHCGIMIACLAVLQAVILEFMYRRINS